MTEVPKFSYLIKGIDMSVISPDSKGVTMFPTKTRLSASRLLRSAVGVVVMSIAAGMFAAIVTTFTAAPAQALCSGTPPATGSWHNIDPNTNSITRVELNWGCADQVICDTDGNCSSPAGTIRVFGRCHPSDCDWGSRTTYAMAGGWEKATYRYDWATKYVWVRPYQYYGRTYLRVWVKTDFTAADGRKDYITDVWMLK